MDTPHGKINVETEYIMRNLNYYLNLDSLKAVYYTNFQSLLQFGIIFWGSTTNLHTALIMQNRIIMVGLRQRIRFR